MPNTNNGQLGMIWAQAGANAANTALGIGISRLGANYDRKQQLKTQAQLNEMSRREQMNLMDYQKQLDLRMWNETNYEAQMKHLKAAGLNPALMYGMGGGGGTTTGNSGGGLNAPSAGLQQTIQAATGLGIDPADTMLKMAQAKLADTQANKLAGVDTVKTEAETSSLLAGIKNTEALTELKKVETRIANIDEWIKNRTKEDAADQIMWTAEKTMNEMNNAWREGLLSAAQFQDKVDLLKKELAGKIIDNELLGQKIKESKSNIEVNNTQIQKLKTDMLQGWEKLSQSEKIMKVDSLIKEYEIMFKGAIGNWRLVNPEVTTKQIDKVMGLEQKK